MTTTHKKLIYYRGTLLSFFIVFFFLGILTTAYAEVPKYVPLVSIPGLTNQSTASLPDYINKVYFLIITIGALYGVVRIAFAGVKYSLSDVVTSKESARGDIKGVLLGLAILLIPFIVLREINPDLIRLDVLSTVDKIRLSGRETRNTVSPGGDSTQGKISSCTSASKNNKWDYLCNVCEEKKIPDGTSCGKTQTVSVPGSCSRFYFTEAQQKDLAGSCRDLCSRLPNGVFSSSAMTCTYGNNPPN